MKNTFVLSLAAVLLFMANGTAADLVYTFDTGVEDFQNVSWQQTAPVGWSDMPTVQMAHTAGGWRMVMVKEFSWEAGGGANNQQLAMRAMAEDSAAKISFDIMVDGGSFPAGAETWYQINVVGNSDGSAGWTQMDKVVDSWHSANDQTLLTWHVELSFSALGWEPGDTWFQLYMGTNSAADVPVNFYVDNVLLSSADADEPIPEIDGHTPWLHAEGNVLKDPAGNVVVLRGVDMVDLGATELWYGGAINMIDRLTDKTDTQGNSPGWYPRVIRIAIYPSDEDDFSSPWTFEPGSDDFYNNLLRPVVDHCLVKGLYAIIDLHYVANTYDHVPMASAFWEYMAARFANDSHVIFELFNEPINAGGSETERWLSVRSDMQTWIDIVRTYAPHNLILVAGPSWSQIIGPAATYPVSDPIGGNNIAYVSHLYPGHLDGTWGNARWYLDQVETCAAVHPVFMTEWGFSASGGTGLTGSITSYGQPLMDWVENMQISHSAWVASYDWRPSMFLQPADVWLPGPWPLRCGEEEMGCFVKDMLYLRRNDNQPGWGGFSFTLVDFGRFAGWWGRMDCGPTNTWCENFDFQHDGVVQIDDLTQFIEYWLWDL